MAELPLRGGQAGLIWPCGVASNGGTVLATPVDEEHAMADDALIAQIHQLVEEEHQIRTGDAPDAERLEQLAAGLER